MKKQICAALVAGVISMPTMADFLGVYAGVDYRTTSTSHTANGYTGGFDDTNNLSGYIAFEHFIPLIPNAKLKYSYLDAEVSGTSTEINSSEASAILYYELFDNDLFELDLGLAYSRIETDFQNLSTDLGQAYGAAKVHIPGAPVYAFAEVIAGSLADDDATDAEFGLAYTFNPDSLLLNVSVRAGYRFQDAEINNFKQENKGLFAGLDVHF
ncbi:TIGR04219 family outer membrane beta-barrel protein [Psychromonas antarctica]|uniref:TIGR04219 family outer membrane beta-barrel protein n=1 Tax=Psychromonas antarctica TaxID=67573 RepID=UPI001EE9302B|nr:TIGR04219 family outer membrane beta-barrel protein [Psychromonas antarctica]MCG6200259.1 TIGR04219 family outer membrane beta-barrel protein [Psychromonas antarctica]